MIIQTKPLGPCLADRHVTRNAQGSDIALLSLRDRALVEKGHHLGFSTALEVEGGQRGFEAHFHAAGARSSPSPAAVARKKLRVAQFETGARQVKLECNTPTDHVRHRAEGIQVEFPDQLPA